MSRSGLQTTMTAPRDPTRLRLGLNPLLTTSLGVGNYQQNTPLSAVSLTSNAQYPQAPASAIQPYNPQEWIGSPIVGPERTHSFHDTQSSPPPPPPYSPPRNGRPVSQSFEPAPANTSAARIPPSNANGHHRPSPEPPANTNFPPPPGVGRGASRERRFGLPSLRSRRDHEPQNASPPEPHPPASLVRPAATRNLSIQIPQEPQRTNSGSSQPGAPGARRAASVGAIETPTSARSRSASQVRWEPGMPLPPPPPGPPPPQSRSQSVNPEPRGSQPIISPPTRRPPPNGVAALGPVPPTPAGWVDEDSGQSSAPNRGRSPGLTIDTTRIDTLSANGSNQAEESATSGSSSGGLARARAVRVDSKSIIQRRAESKTRTSRNSMDGAVQALPNIMVPNQTTLSRRLTINKSTPRSAGRPHFETPKTAPEKMMDSSFETRNSTPRPLSGYSPQPETSTPPFSPQPSKAVPVTEGSPSNVPKALPTPPPQQTRSSSAENRVMGTPAESIHPPPSAASLPPTRHAVISQSADQFSMATVERFRAFAMREAGAETDQDRVRMFADFIVSESRIRRERYSQAIGAMGSEIFDLTRDLFRPMASRRESGTSGGGEWTPQSSEAMRSHRNSMQACYRDDVHANSAPPSANNIPVSPVGGTPNNPNWRSDNYMPSLSPILSMSNVDESDSRGRPASRWWEADSIGNPDQRGMERSKRESKYMGVPKEAHEALQWIDSPKRTEMYGSNEAGPSSPYPPEKAGWGEQKAGWGEQEAALTPQPLRHSMISLLTASQPNTPNPSRLDISRLVTLPPPYPRHHPAVNNNHPDLTEIRTVVRALSDLGELNAAKERFTAESDRRRHELKRGLDQQKASLRANLHQEISSGNMSYAEAAAIEADLKEEEKEKTKQVDKTDFEQFQSQVVMPLNDLLTARIARATQLFDDLAGHLFDDVDNAADMPQEEGDDKPELLEKLTLLKWIFEARELLHRAIYDLLSDRNDRYKAVVITPYRLAGNDEKVRSAEAFFAEDSAKRTYAFSTEVLSRTEALERVMDENVSKGVEAQLSAFWDIAPNLSQVLEKVPLDLNRFQIQIPAVEYDENPVYRDHPLQYLYSLLLHAEKSTYQFIESQTNLLCLLHEVREALTHARGRVIETEVNEERGITPGSASDERAQAMRKSESARLTDDLKEKVRVVQNQWGEALGEGIKNAKERVGGWLLETGGWDEQLEEDGVGGV